MFLVLIYVGRVNKTNISKGKSYMPKKPMKRRKKYIKGVKELKLKHFSVSTLYVVFVLTV